MKCFLLLVRLYLYNNYLYVAIGAELATSSNPACPGVDVVFTCNILASIHRWDFVTSDMSYNMVLNPSSNATGVGPFALEVISTTTLGGSVNVVTESTARVTPDLRLDGANLTCSSGGTATVEPQTVIAQLASMSCLRAYCEGCRGVHSFLFPDLTSSIADVRGNLTSVSVEVALADIGAANCAGVMYNVDVGVEQGGVQCSVNNPTSRAVGEVYIGELNLCRCRYNYTAFITTAGDDGPRSPTVRNDPDFSGRLYMYIRYVKTF